MDILVVGVNIIFFLLGVFLIMFSKRFETLMIEEGNKSKLVRYLTWYPRLNLVLIGLFLLLATSHQIFKEFSK